MRHMPPQLPSLTLVQAVLERRQDERSAILSWPLITEAHGQHTNGIIIKHIHSRGVLRIH